MHKRFNQTPILALLGPTASGKSSVALQLAQDFPIDILNVDAMQVYKHLNIGTAKPSAQEQTRAPHFLYNLIDPDQDMTAFAYAEYCHKALEQSLENKRIPLLVGGSGFYFQAIGQAANVYPPGTIEDQSIEDLYAFIQNKNPECAADVHAKDQYRIRRLAFLIQNMPEFNWNNYSQLQSNRYDINCFAINWPRDVLYQRINQRVEMMFKQDALIEETKTVLQDFPQSKAKLNKIIGYKQCLAYLAGEHNKAQSIENTQQKTRNYAKRQSTWFKNRQPCQWFSPEHIFDKVKDYLLRALD